jgi:hypothetical protein
MPAPFELLEDKTGDIAKTLRKLANIRVAVGIPETKDSRRDGPIGNAALAYIHNTGSPINNIPARPHLEPGIKESETKWTGYFEQAAKFAFEGNAGGMDRALNAAGQTAVSAVKTKIINGLQPPLSPRTVAARQRKRKGRKAQTAAQMTPLVDTAQLLNAYTYVIKKGK